MIAAIGLALVVQGAPAVTAGVDHARLRVGEELMLTVQARSRSADPLTLVLPPLAGFAIVGSSERTEVSMSGTGGPLRTSTRQLVLRAARAGTLTIGAVRAEQGRAVVETDPITVVVDSAAPGVEEGFSPIARALLQAAPAPRRTDQVSLNVVVPAETVLVGQQVDIVVAAWFPRELRSRLRRPPIVTLATPAAVWAYPQTAPTDVVVSRLLHGQWMDLFALHQVIFPLAPGRIVIPRAAVEYALPVTFSFFSREDRYRLESDSAVVAVLALPANDPAPGAAGLAARDLTLDIGILPAEARVGEPLELTATLRGVGNVALWPEPTLRWPAGFRAYPAQTTTQLEPLSGFVAGTKTFHYLVVPDSAGSFLLSELRYPYYDLARGANVVLRTAPRAIAVAPGVEPRAARSLPPLLRDTTANRMDAIADAVSPPGWLAVLVLPPALLIWRRRRRRAAPAVMVASRGPPLSTLGRLEREFHTVLASHVPEAHAREGDALTRALRAAGVESAVADHVMRLRDRLRAARYGPRGVGDAAELAAELRQVLNVLEAEPPGKRRRVIATVGLLLLCAVAPTMRGDGLQSPSAEALYEAGALRAAADSFAARASAEPRVAAHWYNLGATLYRAGADGKAIAAWTRAARLSPRHGAIRRARQLLPLPDADSEALLAVGPATPGEWWLVAAPLWLAAWLLALSERRRFAAGTLAALAVAAALLGGMEWRRRAQPVAVVIGSGTAVRVAPYGAASAATTLDAGAAVLVGHSYGRWLEVSRGDGLRGWVLGMEVARL